MMALALADNAFENKFTSLAQIYDLVVPGTTDRIRLKWDKEWAERPVFRDVEKSLGDEVCESMTRSISQGSVNRLQDLKMKDAEKSNRVRKGCAQHRPHKTLAKKQTPGGNVRISKTKSLSYQKHRHHFVRLGRTCGYRKRLQWYDWRRASGKKLNGMAIHYSSLSISMLDMID
jgi:hypothetical protein